MKKYTDLEKEAICILVELQRKQNYKVSEAFLFDLNELKFN